MRPAKAESCRGSEINHLANLIRKKQLIFAIPLPLLLPDMLGELRRLSRREGLPAVYPWRDTRTILRYSARLAVKGGASARLARRFNEAP